MASRSKASSRRERDDDSSESLKPLVVLVLLGTILYGAWSVVNNGPGGGTIAAPEPARTDLAAAPAFAPPPQVEVPAAPPAAVLPAVPAAAPTGMAPPAAATAATVSPAFPGDAPPTYLSAVSAPPPVAAPASAAPPVMPPPAAFPPAAFTPADAPPLATPAPAPAAARGIGSPQPSQQQTTVFASAWADAHDKLAAGRYAEALAVLSSWYDDPSLGLEESQRLEELLGQLAGTVIYSQQDLLLPPHVVEPGENLQTIATPLAVPWQLLAKINGVTDPSQLMPGESLKIVRGPFDAVVSVSRRRISLQVGGNYAGSFPVVVGRQVRDRVGGAVSVVTVQRAEAAPEQGPGAQVAWSQPAPKSITLAEGLSIQAVADPGMVSDDAIPGTSLIVAQRDLDELADILGPGSRVLVRQ